MREAGREGLPAVPDLHFVITAPLESSFFYIGRALSRYHHLFYTQQISSS
jgi:hypothetical protein